MAVMASTQLNLADISGISILAYFGAVNWERKPYINIFFVQGWI